jgi:hypothetical protein
VDAELRHLARQHRIDVPGHDGEAAAGAGFDELGEDVRRALGRGAQVGVDDDDVGPAAADLVEQGGEPHVAADDLQSALAHRARDRLGDQHARRRHHHGGLPALPYLLASVRESARHGWGLSHGTATKKGRNPD